MTIPRVRRKDIHERAKCGNENRHIDSDDGEELADDSEDEVEDDRESTSPDHHE